jgi:hypothetical protein
MNGVKNKLIMKGTIKISKDFTSEDWKELRPQLLYSNDNWPKATQVFQDRIESRFFNPIEKIKSIGKNEGEGFSIALISVVILESIAAFELGKIYRIGGKNLAPHEYYRGIDLLKSFLRSNSIFNQHFDSNTKVQNFYENIRCGLVHEARTMDNDVIISNESPKNTKPNSIYFKVDGELRLNRDLMLVTIKSFVENYKDRLLKNELHLRSKFIIKLDDISGLKHVWYFIYGSNLYEEQLKVRLKDIDENYLQKEKCLLKGYEFTYNKRSEDGSSKANIIKTEKGIVEGIAILILEKKLDEFKKKWEAGYDKEEVNIQTENNINEKNCKDTFKAYTFISTNLTTVPPSDEYVNKIIKGAYENNLSQEYIENKIMYVKP